MVSRDELQSYCHDLLEVEQISDYAPNGLQVQGRAHIKKIVTGVTASKALIDAAISAQADAIIVHHGYFWLNTSPCIVGMQHARIKALLTHDINLFGYHLPLDVHPTLGNNTELAKKLNIKLNDRLPPDGKSTAYLCYGELAKPMRATDFAQHIATALQRQPLHINAGPDMIQRVAWCTGGAQGYFDQVIALKVDAYITGEASEKNYHSAVECGVHFFAAGHHATERYGVQALGAHLADKFGLQHQFIDIDNPI